MANRLLKYKYALCNFFRKRGYEIDTKNMTIVIDDIYELTYKEQQRLKQLQNWGFKVIDQNSVFMRDLRNRTNSYSDYDYEESFIDFADEVLRNYY